ncbi:Tgl4p [Sugiyamaella lignohabitans]|uniref:Patatin-like phospholipase domain-containing protein n=1 Tax=Sugiyamaella lignohabitans TaxID=796027 RepID=A0A167FVV9_9ASCO|nr:Tgl4p [Sugiyamaella lignohabitans]ANB15765.1 Tgl4p [Sugiyamaella lignohabitans]
MTGTAGLEDGVCDDGKNAESDTEIRESHRGLPLAKKLNGDLFSLESTNENEAEERVTEIHRVSDPLYDRTSRRVFVTGSLGNLLGDDGQDEDENSDASGEDSGDRFPEYFSDHMTMKVKSIKRPGTGQEESHKRNGRLKSSSQPNKIPSSSWMDISLHQVLKSVLGRVPRSTPGIKTLTRIIDLVYDSSINTYDGASEDPTGDSELDSTSISEQRSDKLEAPFTPPPGMRYGLTDRERHDYPFTQYNSQTSRVEEVYDNSVSEISRSNKPKRGKTSDLIEALKEQQRKAETYSHWLEASRELDSLLGYDEWKAQDESDLYDSELVRHRLEQLQQAREDGDMERLLVLVRTTLQRNLGNIGDPQLYQYSYTGTKHLIENYICECELSLQTLMASPKIDDTRLLGTLIQTRKAFGRTALVLSGGSTFGVLHIGVLFELWSAKLLPRVISGSSAGSIFASILCIHLDEELDSLLQLLEGDFDIFEKTGSEESTLVRITRFLKYGTWFDNKYISSTLRSLLGDLTFQEAYYRTRRVLNVTVSPSSVHEMPKLLNYLTAPNVLIWSAVCASCSVPLVFASFDILAKNPKTGEHYSWTPATFIDGSVDNDLPLARLSEMFNVNHFIACQVNPHVAPFLKLSEAISGGDSPISNDKSTRSLTRSIISRWSALWTFTQEIISDEVSHFLLILTELGIFNNYSSKFRSVLAQQYSGDITILPQIKWSELGQLFKNPSPEFFKKTRERAAASTWHKISIIRNHCAIELALDRAILEIRSRLIPHPFAHSEQQATAGRPPRMYHYRRKSEIVLQKTLLRKNSWQDVGSKKYWSPSPPFLSAHSSHVSLHSLNPNSAVARFKDAYHHQSQTNLFN